MAAFDGSMKAIVSADITDYQKNMNTVAGTASSVSGKVNGSFTGMSTGAEGATKSTGFLGSKIGQIAAGVGAVALVSKGIDVLKSSVGSAVARFDTLNAYPKVMKQMGYSTADTNKSVSVLKKGVDGLPTSLQDLTKSAQSFAILTGSATKGAQAASALNDAFIASGASAATAEQGTQDYSKMLAEGKVNMQDWNGVAGDMPLAMKQVANSFGLTGKSAVKELYNKLKAGDITMEQLNDQFIQLDGGAKGFAKTARAASGGIGTSFTNMKNAVVNGLEATIQTINDSLKSAGLKNGIATIFDQGKQAIVKGFAVFNQVVKVAIPPIVATFKTLFDFVNQNKGWLQPLVTGIAGGIVAFKTISATIKGVTTAIKTVQTVTNVARALTGIAKGSQAAETALSMLSKESKIAAAAQSAYNTVTKIATGIQTAFNAVMAMNPFVLIIVAITAVVAALVWFFTQTKTGQAIWKSFTDWLTNVWKAMPGFFSGIWNSITSGVSSAVQFIQGIWNGISAFFAGIWQGVVNVAVSVWSKFASILSGIWNGIVSVVKIAITIVVDTILIIIGSFILLWQAIWSEIGSTVTAIWNVITSAVSVAINFVSNTIQTIMNVIVGIWTAIWNTIESVSMAVWNAISPFISAAINSIMSVISSVMSVISSIWTSIWNVIKSVASTVWNGITAVVESAIGIVKSVVSAGVNAVMSVWNGITRLVSIAASAFGKVVSTVSGGINRAVSAVKNAVSGMLSAGSNFVMGFVKGITGAIGNAVSAAASMAKKALNAAKSTLGIHSPSREMATVGMFTVLGMAKGIDNNSGHVEKAMTSIANGVITTGKSAVNTFQNSLNNLSVGNALNGINELQQKIQNQGLVAQTSFAGGDLSTSNELSQEVLSAPSTTVNVTVEQNWDGDKVYYAIKNKDARNRARINVIKK